MNKLNLITQEMLKEWFDYHPEGYFVYKKSRYANQKIGAKVSGSINDKGYVRIYIDGTRMRLHRAIFLWNHGWLPEIIDHINSCKTDNRIENLRVATNAENLCNRGAPANSKTGFKNIHFLKNKFNVVIRKGGKKFSQCGIKSLEDALQIRNDALKTFHGEFALIN